MKTELYLNDTRVELGDDLDFTLNRQYTDIEDITSIIVDYSKTVSVPMTAGNNRIFNNIYNVNRVSGGTYDPSKKIPMSIYYNSSLMMEGYAVLNKIDRTKKVYEINLYGQLGKIFSDLKDKTLEDYSNLAPLMFSYISLDRYSVLQSFNRTPASRNLGWPASNWSDYYGFAPQMLGNSDLIDTSSYEDGTEIKKFEDQVAENRKYLLKSGLDINQYGEIRSYTTRPYVYVDKLIQLVKAQINSGDYEGYKMLLDPEWCSSTNPYYADMVYFPENKEDKTAGQGGNGKITLYNAQTPSTSPYTFQPRVMDDTLEVYSYDIDDNLIAFDNSTGKNIELVISGNEIKINETFTGPQNIPFIHNSGFYRWEYSDVNVTGYPVMCLEVSDAEGVVQYRYCLVQDNVMLINSSVGRTTNGYWSILSKADSRNIVPISINETGTFDGTASPNITTITRTRTFKFPDLPVKNNGYELTFRILDIDSKGRIMGNVPMSANYFEIPVKTHAYGHHTVFSSYTRTWNMTTPSTISEKGNDGKSYSNFNIITALGSDFSPFNWLIDYAKKFRLFFDVDYLNKTILLTHRYFHTGSSDITITDAGKTATIHPISYKEIKADYSKDFIVEPLVQKDFMLDFGYKENKSLKSGIYKRRYGVDYGDLNIYTGIELNNVIKHLSSGKESVFVPVDTNAVTWSSISQSSTIQYGRLFNTNKVITTLDESGKPQDMEFYAFRDNNVSIPVNRRIRLSDDSENMKNLGQYCYLSTDDNVDQVVLTSFPQFDNFILRSNTYYWTTFNTPVEVYTSSIQSGTNNTNIYNSRWSDYLTEMYNPDNKRVTCYVKMTYLDIFNFKFNTLVLLENSKFLVNRIMDFSPNRKDFVKVELIQIQDKENL